MSRTSHIRLLEPGGAECPVLELVFGGLELKVLLLAVEPEVLQHLLSFQLPFPIELDLGHLTRSDLASSSDTRECVRP
jgi:hypothetical protein